MNYLILKGLIPINDQDPQKLLKKILEEQIKPIDNHESHWKESKNTYQKQIAQQPKQIKKPEQRHDHSSHHDASRQYAGSRRRGKC